MLLVVFLCAESHGDDKAAQDNNRVDLICPNSEDISPCVCFSFPDKTTHLDCSAVRSEAQLAELFSSLAVPAFTSLTIEYNTDIKVLRVGDLGNVTFQEIYVHGGALEEVENGSLSASYSIAHSLDFSSNSLTSFCFEDIKQFTSLLDLNLSDNKLYELPQISSQTLTSLSIGKNPLTSLSPSVFSDTPSLRAISIFGTELNNLFAGTFSTLANLTWLNLSENELTHIHTDAIHIKVFGASIHLDYNSIKYVLPGGISGLRGGFVYLYTNNIVELEEDVWRPLLEEGNTLDLKANPLACGCDVAWLVKNATLLQFVDSKTSCSSGDLLVDLDAEYLDLVC